MKSTIHCLRRFIWKGLSLDQFAQIFFLEHLYLEHLLRATPKFASSANISCSSESPNISRTLLGEGHDIVSFSVARFGAGVTGSLLRISWTILWLWKWSSQLTRAEVAPVSSSVSKHRCWLCRILGSACTTVSWIHVCMSRCCSCMCDKEDRDSEIVSVPLTQRNQIGHTTSWTYTCVSWSLPHWEWPSWLSTFLQHMLTHNALRSLFLCPESQFDGLTVSLLLRFFSKTGGGNLLNLFFLLLRRGFNTAMDSSPWLGTENGLLSSIRNTNRRFNHR